MGLFFLRIKISEPAVISDPLKSLSEPCPSSDRSENIAIGDIYLSKSYWPLLFR